MTPRKIDEAVCSGTETFDAWHDSSELYWRTRFGDNREGIFWV